MDFQKGFDTVSNIDLGGIKTSCPKKSMKYMCFIGFQKDISYKTYTFYQYLAGIYKDKCLDTPKLYTTNLE